MSKKFFLACAVSCAILTMPAQALAEDIVDGAETIASDIGGLFSTEQTNDDAPDLTDETEETTADDTAATTTQTAPTTTTPQATTKPQGTNNPSTGVALTGAAATGIAAALAISLRKRK